MQETKNRTNSLSIDNLVVAIFTPQNTRGRMSCQWAAVFSIFTAQNLSSPRILHTKAAAVNEEYLLDENLRIFTLFHWKFNFFAISSFITPTFHK